MTDLRETKWTKEMKDKYYAGISNFFIINGNINDYPISGYSFMDYLYAKLSEMGIKDIYKYDHANDSSGLNFYMRQVIETKPTALVVPYAEFVYPKGEVSGSTSVIELHETINSSVFHKSNGIVILVTDSSFLLSDKILSATSRGTVLDIDYPSKDNRLDFIRYLSKTSKTKIKSDISDDMFAEITAGLTLISIEDIYLQAESVGFMKRDFIIDRKTELIKKEYGDVLTVLDSDKFSFDDYAGQNKLKQYHREVIINPMMSGNIDIVPKGIIYTGPPGTGKTHFAKCLAGEAGISFVELSMSALQDKWVGESEKKFDRALTCIKSIAPVGVFIDEIDQAFSRGENESNSVNKNLFAMFLTILSDPEYRGKILWIGATNYVNNLDEALKRTGRFDKKMPFLPPKKEDRVAVFKIYLDKSKLENGTTVQELDKLADLTDGYTQAEIEGIVIKAWEVAIRKNSNSIDYKHLAYAIKCIRTTKNDKIQEMTQIAIDECNDMEFMPDGYKQFL